MTSPFTMTITPSQAADAYGRIDRGAPGIPANDTGAGASFGAALERAAQGVMDAGHAADAQAAAGIAGTGNLTEVVAAVSRAELALQATTAIRDRMVSAYQEIMRIPI